MRNKSAGARLGSLRFTFYLLRSPTPGHGHPEKQNAPAAEAAGAPCAEPKNAYARIAFSVCGSKACSFSTEAQSLIVCPAFTGVSGLTRATISVLPTMTSR